MNILKVKMAEEKLVKKNILVSFPKLSKLGGVSAYWNAILPEFKNYSDINIQEIEIGGHEMNIAGLLRDQLDFKKKLNQKHDLVVLNPSLGIRSFFRDAFFAKKIIKKNIPFLVFFHGWDLKFEKKIDRFFKNLFIESFGKAQVIIVLSEDFKNKLKDWGYNGKVIVETTTLNASLIHDFSFKNKIESLQSEEEISILFLARLEREKGIFETIEAFKSVSKKYGHIELIIAGDGLAIDEVKKKVLNNHKVKVLGYVEGEEKVKAFAESHIYCLPSYSEGLPITVLEAMAFGMPIITTEVGGLKTFLQEGKMGYFTEIKNGKDLGNKIELFVKNKDKIIEIGKYNYNYAKLNLLNTQAAKRLMNYFINIID